MTSQERVASAEVLKAMGHPIRLGVVELLAEGEKTVSELFAKLECSQSVMSTQLAILRNQNLIKMRREGNIKYCTLRNRDFVRLLRCLEKHVNNALRID